MNRGHSAIPKSRTQTNSTVENNKSIAIEEEITKDKNILFELKQQRKLIEEDVQLLANRVHLLEAEEKKALKKIEETRKKAKNVLEAKRRNFEQSRSKMLQKLKEEEDKYLNMVNTNKKKSDNKDKIESSKQQLLSKIKTDIDRMRKYKQDQREVATFIRSEEVQKNSERAQAVKDGEKAAKIKKNHPEKTRPASAKNTRQAKPEKTENWKFKEYDLESLEEKEIRLKNKLKEVQRLQKEVEYDFKNAITFDGSTPFYPAHGFIMPISN